VADAVLVIFTLPLVGRHRPPSAAVLGDKNADAKASAMRVSEANAVGVGVAVIRNRESIVRRSAALRFFTPFIL
jgi:hypothetical protein